MRTACVLLFLFFFTYFVANTFLHGNILPNKSTNERHQTRASHKDLFADLVKMCPPTGAIQTRTLELTAFRFPAQY